MLLQKNKDKILLLGLMLFVGFSRILFASKLLYHWDSVQFALALDEWDLATHQPHPPGYIIYIFFGRLINALLKNPNQSLVLVSIIAGVLSIPLIFAVTRMLTNKKEAAWATTLIFSTLPVYWFYQEVALNYSFDVFWVLLIVYLLLKHLKSTSLQPKNNLLFYLFSLFVGLSGGIRLQTFILITPLALWAIWRMPNWRNRIVGLSLILLGILMWAVPLLYFSGGSKAYLDISVRHTKAFVTMLENQKDRSVLWIGGTLVLSFWHFLNLLLPFFVVGLFKLKQFSKQARVILSFWVVPAMVYYTIYLFSTWDLGLEKYLLAFLPGLLIIGSFGVITSVKNVTLRNVFILVAFLFNLFLFLSSGGKFSYQKIKTQDEIIKERVELVNEKFHPQETIVVISKEYLYHGFRHSMYYLPDYPTIQLYYDSSLNYPNKTKYLQAQDRQLKYLDVFEAPAQIQYIVLFGDMPKDLEEAGKQGIIAIEDLEELKNFGELKRFDTKSGIPLFYIERIKS